MYRYRERRTVLIPEIPPLSFQCASQDSSHLSSTNNLRPHCRLPASHPGLTAICNSAYPSSTAVSISACKTSSLLLVTWLLCEISHEAAHQEGQLVREGRSGSQSVWLRPGLWAWICYTELLSRKPTARSPCVGFAASEKSTQEEKETLGRSG